MKYDKLERIFLKAKTETRGNRLMNSSSRSRNNTWKDHKTEGTRRPENQGNRVIKGPVDQGSRVMKGLGDQQTERNHSLRSLKTIKRLKKLGCLITLEIE